MPVYKEALRVGIGKAATEVRDKAARRGVCEVNTRSQRREPGLTKSSPATP